MLSARQKYQLTQSSTYVARQKNQLQVTQRAEQISICLAPKIQLTQPSKIAYASRQKNQLTQPSELVFVARPKIQLTNPSRAKNSINTTKQNSICLSTKNQLTQPSELVFVARPKIQLTNPSKLAYVARQKN